MPRTETESFREMKRKQEAWRTLQQTADSDSDAGEAPSVNFLEPEPEPEPKQQYSRGADLWSAVRAARLTSEFLSDVEVLERHREGLPWGWEPAISSTHQAVYFMTPLGHCQWEVPTEDAWDEEHIPPEIAEAHWLRMLHRVKVRELPELGSRVIGSLPAGEMVYVLEMTQAGVRNRRACIRCHMGWFSLTTVDPSKSEALYKELVKLSAPLIVARARNEGVDEHLCESVEAGRRSRPVLVQKIVDLAAGHQRASNPNTVWERMLQVVPCTAPMLLPGTELRVGSEVTPRQQTQQDAGEAAPSALPAANALADSGQGSPPHMPAPPPPRQSPPRSARQYHRPRAALAQNEGLSAGVYPHHVPSCKQFI